MKNRNKQKILFKDGEKLPKEEKDFTYKLEYYLEVIYKPQNRGKQRRKE